MPPAVFVEGIKRLGYRKVNGANAMSGRFRYTIKLDNELLGVPGGTSVMSTTVLLQVAHVAIEQALAAFNGTIWIELASAGCADATTYIGCPNALCRSFVATASMASKPLSQKKTLLWLLT